MVQLLPKVKVALPVDFEISTFPGYVPEHVRVVTSASLLVKVVVPVKVITPFWVKLRSIDIAVPLCVVVPLLV